jgi:hypothetical protein
VFQWSAWAHWIGMSAGTRSWYTAGLAFRSRMDDAGCVSGDTWFVNEMPTSWHNPDKSVGARKATRQRIADLLRGLYHGGLESNVKGFAADVVEPQDQPFLNQKYKPGEKAAYADTDFWRAIRIYLSGFVKETYTECTQVCVGGQTAAAIADKGVNNYTYHQRFLALAAPAVQTYAAVKTTLAQTYMPLLNGFWGAGQPYRTDTLTLRQMIRLVREQIYAAKRATSFTYGSGGRIGFAWSSNGDASSLDQLAANLAVALHDAYAGSAGAACTDNDGVDTYYFGCPPAGLPGVTQFNSEWNIFKTWN